MAALTAIELGADSCVLARVTVRGTEVRVAQVDTLDPAAFPGPEGFSTALKQMRRTRHFPRHARVVLWGVPEAAVPTDPTVAPLLAPLAKAGFRLDRVVSPCNALAALARLRQPRPDAAVAWVAVNRSAVAIAVVRPGEQLFADAFEWDSSIGATGSQARLLQRYSLVAYLAPQVRRGIEVAREKGWRVDAVVTCGNLPDLRSLTMPLIEELDLEVETLDSLDGLEVKEAVKDKLTESAPLIRIACAGAVARPARGRTGSTERFSAGALFRAAALVVAVAGVAWLWISGRGTPTRPAATPAPVAATPPNRAAATVTRDAQPVRQPPLKAQPVTRTPAPPPVATGRPTTAATVSPPARNPVPGTAPKAMPATTPHAVEPGNTPPPLRAGPARTDRVGAQHAQKAPLTDPIPRVTTILVSPERRFAMLDGGRVVSIGDTIGQRVVASIEPRAIVLREPSGLQIRVGLGGRLLGVENGR
jgi:hypothetical protein